MESREIPFDRHLLRQLVPLNSLSEDRLSDLFKKARIDAIERGRSVFRAGANDADAVFLVEGSIELRFPSGNVSVLSAGQPEALRALAPQQPRACDAVAATDCKVLRVDTNHLDVLLTWDQSAGYVVTDIDEGNAEDDWMMTMLQSPLFMQIPPANIQSVFATMEAMPVTQGDVVIRQGDKGDYYYVLRKGSAQVSRTAPNGAEIKLAVLKEGTGFGEEALLAEVERNATITMLTEGLLMRLSKQHFDQLLKAPVLHEIDLQEGQVKSHTGAKWLDVRTESEHAQSAIANSLNVPLYLLRLKLRELDPETTYLVYCDTGSRSAAAAYLLSEAGFDVFLLAGGYQGEQG